MNSVTDVMPSRPRPAGWNSLAKTPARILCDEKAYKPKLNLAKIPTRVLRYCRKVYQKGSAGVMDMFS